MAGERMRRQPTQRGGSVSRSSPTGTQLGRARQKRRPNEENISDGRLRPSPLCESAILASPVYTKYGSGVSR